MLAKQAVMAAPGQFDFREIDLVCQDDQIVVKVASCGLCNWELNHWKGYIVPACGYPFPLGHEWAGTVVETGKKVTKFKVGDKVSSLEGSGAFADYLVCKEAAACV